MDATANGTVDSSGKRVILALDTDSLEEALGWVKRFRSWLKLFKVGSQLFTEVGPRAVEAVKGLGGEVFLDLKYHDIPNTVGRAVASASRLGVRFFNVHALGGEQMIKSAVEAARQEAKRGGADPPKVLAVTVLTSLDGQELAAVGLKGTVETCVIRLAEMALRVGVDGLVASPRELRALRRAFGGEVLLVTPGIRIAGDGKDDQKRVMAPWEALQAGADFIVMGRSLLGARDPAAILEEIAKRIH